MKELTDAQFRARLKEAGWKDHEIDEEMKSIAACEEADETAGAPPDSGAARGSMAGFYYGTEWREEKPDQPGWWWCLGPNRILHVMRQRAFGDRLCAHMINEWIPVDEMANVLWAGPIPQPKEP